MSLTRTAELNFFERTGKTSAISNHYQWRQIDSSANESADYDPYCFPLQLLDFDLHLFAQGKYWHIYPSRQRHTVDGVVGVLFATCASSAERSASSETSMTGTVVVTRCAALAAPVYSQLCYKDQALWRQLQINAMRTNTPGKAVPSNISGSINWLPMITADYNRRHNRKRLQQSITATNNDR